MQICIDLHKYNSANLLGFYFIQGEEIMSSPNNKINFTYLNFIRAYLKDPILSTFVLAQHLLKESLLTRCTPVIELHYDAR